MPPLTSRMVYLATAVVFAVEAMGALLLGRHAGLDAKPNGLRFMVLAVVILAIAALVSGALGRARPALGWPEVGVRLGLLAAILWIANLLVETYAELSPVTHLIVGAPLLLGGFLVWGTAGWLAGRAGEHWGSAVAASVGASLVCLAGTLAVGLALPVVSLDRLTELIAGSPEEISSAWNDPAAYAVANTLDAAGTHVLVGLVVAVVVGSVGFVLSQSGRQPGSAGFAKGVPIPPS